MSKFTVKALAAVLCLAFLTGEASAQGSTTGSVAGKSAPDKIVFVFQKQKDPKAIEAAADRLAEALTKEVGIPVEVLVPTSYGASVQAVVSEKAHAAYTSALPFLLAKAEAPVRMIVAEEREGRTDYDSIYVVPKDSPAKSVADLRGKKMVFTSPTSTSGYVMALYRLIKDGLLKPGQPATEFFSSVSFGGGYDRALLAVANGQADACAVSDYTMQGAKADVYLKPEQREKLRVLAETPGVPTHGVFVRADLPQDVQDKMQSALLKISSEEPKLLSDVYGAAKLVKADNSHVADLSDALEKAGLDIKSVARD